MSTSFLLRSVALCCAFANDNLKRNKMLVKKQTDGTVEKTLTRRQISVLTPLLSSHGLFY